jgi:hypothetical protein
METGLATGVGDDRRDYCGIPPSGRYLRHEKGNSASLIYKYMLKLQNKVIWYILLSNEVRSSWVQTNIITSPVRGFDALLK